MSDKKACQMVIRAMGENGVEWGGGRLEHRGGRQGAVSQSIECHTRTVGLRPCRFAV